MRGRTSRQILFVPYLLKKIDFCFYKSNFHAKLIGIIHISNTYPEIPVLKKRAYALRAFQMNSYFQFHTFLGGDGMRKDRIGFLLEDEALLVAGGIMPDH